MRSAEDARVFAMFEYQRERRVDDSEAGRKLTRPGVSRPVRTSQKLQRIRDQTWRVALAK